MRRDSIIMVIGAVIAVLAQIILAPNIAIFSAMPNFCLAYVLVVAIVRPGNNATLVLAFVLGLVYDLLGNGPVGAMAFLLVLAAFVMSRAFMIFNNDTLFMPITMLVIGAFLVEILYAVFMVLFGISASPLEAFFYRALPCALYDCVVALLFYPLALKFMSDTPLASSSKPTQQSTMHVSMTSKKNVGTVRSKTRRH